MFTEIFSRTSTIHPGIFLGRALWADSVSPRMNTIASRDQFKPIRIGENLVVNNKVDKLIFQLTQYFSVLIYRIVKELVNCMRKQDCHFLRFLWTLLWKHVNKEMSRDCTRKPGKDSSKVFQTLLNFFNVLPLQLFRDFYYFY